MGQGRLPVAPIATNRHPGWGHGGEAPMAFPCLGQLRFLLGRRSAIPDHRERQATG